MDAKFSRSEEEATNLTRDEKIDTDLAATQKIGPLEMDGRLGDQTTTRTLEKELSAHSEGKPSDAVDQNNGVQDISKAPKTQTLIPGKVVENSKNQDDPKNSEGDNSILPLTLNLISEKVDEGMKNQVDTKNGVGDNPILHPTPNLTSEKIDEGMKNRTASRTLERRLSVHSSSKLREHTIQDVEKIDEDLENRTASRTLERQLSARSSSKLREHTIQDVEKIDGDLKNRTASRTLERQLSVHSSSKLHEQITQVVEKTDECPKNRTASRTLERQLSVRSSSKFHDLATQKLEKPLSHQRRKMDAQTEERSRRSEDDLDNLVSPSAYSDVSPSVGNSDGISTPSRIYTVSAKSANPGERRHFDKEDQSIRADYEGFSDDGRHSAFHLPSSPQNSLLSKAHLNINDEKNGTRSKRSVNPNRPSLRESNLRI